MKTDLEVAGEPPRYYDHDEDWSWRSAKAFPLWSAHSPREYDRILEILRALLPPSVQPLPVSVGNSGDPIMLDVGCGAGRFGLHANAAGYTYLGVDDSRAAIALGRKFYPEIALAVCDFVKPIAAEYLGKFRLVTSINAAHCIVSDSDRQQFFANLKDAVAPAGTLALTTMCAPVAEGFRASKRPRVYKSAWEIIAEIRDAGMQIVRFDVRGPAKTAKISNLTVVARPSVNC